MVGVTASDPLPIRSDRPSNVTSAFSEAQDRLAELKRAMTILSERGIEKLDKAPVIIRDIESPIVTFVSPEFVKVVVEQPTDEAVVHVEPVKPFVHIHAQEPLSIKELPPFWQAVEAPASHCWIWDNVDAVLALGLWMTSSSRGTTTAAAIMIKRIKRTSINPQHGRPQQRLPRFLDCPFFTSQPMPLVPVS